MLSSLFPLIYLFLEYEQAIISYRLVIWNDTATCLEMACESFNYQKHSEDELVLLHTRLVAIIQTHSIFQYLAVSTSQYSDVLFSTLYMLSFLCPVENIKDTFGQ